MNTRRLDQGFSLVGAVSWGAIASGAFVALALELVLLLFGAGVATSTGDRIPGNGFALWAIIVQLCSIAIGAALTARLAHAEGKPGGAVAGLMTWAVALVVGGALQGITIAKGSFMLGGVWTAFLAAIISLGGALLGGSFGGTLGVGERRVHRDTLEYPIDVHQDVTH